MERMHKHCYVCAKPIPLEETFCSPQCKDIYEKHRRRNRVISIILWTFLFFVIFLFILQLTH
ncbi:MAG: DUF2116 family Zn-ribbon domain-containing protein [Candidatus Hydrothermarchaeota archaeon]